MPQAVLVDTNIAIYLATGHSLAAVYRPHLEGNVLALSFPSVAELYFTARRARAPARAIEYWRERLPYYTILMSDLETCEIWAEITAECMARGRPRQDNDLWIAATALRHELPLVTHNRRDFADIPRLTLVSEA